LQLINIIIIIKHLRHIIQSTANWLHSDTRTAQYTSYCHHDGLA